MHFIHQLFQNALSENILLHFYCPDLSIMTVCVSECLGDVHRVSVTEQLRDSERRRLGPERERRGEESQHLGVGGG